MLPAIQANSDEIASNRELLLALVELQVEQDRITAQHLRGIADSIDAMASALEVQQSAAEQRLADLANALEQKASGALRQRAGNALRAAAARLTQLNNKLKGNS